MWSRCLREARESGEIGFALLQISISSLLALFSHVKEHGRVTGQFLNSGQTVGISIEGSFEETQGNRTFLKDLLRPLHSLFFQAFQWNYGIYQAHIQRLLCGILPAKIPDLAGFLVTDYSGHICSAPACIKTANSGTSLPESSIVSRNSQVA